MDRVADVLERVAAELDTLSKSTFKSEDLTTKRSLRRADRELRNTLTQVGKCGDTLGNLRTPCWRSGASRRSPSRPAPSGPSRTCADRLTTLRQDVASLNDYDQQLNGKVSFLLDAVLGFINIEQNNGVKVLTVVSVVGIPPTFVVGLYGMNFKDMPELGWEHGLHVRLGDDPGERGDPAGLVPGEGLDLSPIPDRLCQGWRWVHQVR